LRKGLKYIVNVPWLRAMFKRFRPS